MAISRYVRAPRLDFGNQQGTSRAVVAIRNAIAAGTIATKTTVLRGAERLDTIAGSTYGEAKYWWVLAAASDVGWGMQCPAGTIIVIPDLSAVLKLIAG